jgi:hypothetical protein
MTGTALAAFDILCACGNELQALRDEEREGSDPWTGLTELIQAVDGIIDGLVRSTGLDGDDEE